MAKLQETYELSVAATKPLESEVLALDGQINSLLVQIGRAEQDLKVLEESIFEREVDLEFQKQLLESRVRNTYVRQQRLNPWWSFLADDEMQMLLRGVAYKQAVADKDKEIIRDTGQQLQQLAEDKKQLKENTARLKVIKEKVAVQQKFLEGEIVKAKEYQKTLTGQIAELSARQQQLLAEKTGSFTTSVGEVPLTGDANSRPDYNPGFSPAFGGFSFGAPHFKGMSQYGARGRAQSGQNEEQIIKAYYGDVRIEQRGDLPASINTSVGSLPLEANYLYGLAEMPASWDDNNLAALKAQAIAARSYAMSYVGWRVNGGGGDGSICTTESCQVYNASKVSNVPDNWKRAVDETRGKIIVSNSTNEIISAWYSASSGGYQESYETLGHNTPNMWDTVCGNQGCWTGDAYEKIGESPWFYKGWYRSRSGQDCGRSHPWLTQDEFADIVNAAIVLQHDGGAVTHLSQVDGCFDQVPDTWDTAKVREEAEKQGGAVSSISSVNVVYGTNGVTQKVVMQTDKGTKEFDGQDFKLVFNLRAPGVIHLKSGLFNIEKK